MKSYLDSITQEKIDLFEAELVKTIQHLLSDFELIMLHKEKLGLDFKKVVDLLAMTIVPDADETLMSTLDKYYEDKLWEHYWDWAPLPNVQKYLRTIGKFHQQSAMETLDDINGGFFLDHDGDSDSDDSGHESKMASLASYDNNINYEQVTRKFHELTAEHVQKEVDRLRATNCFKNYADFESTAGLYKKPSSLKQSISQVSLDSPKQTSEARSDEVNDAIKGIIETAKETFKYDNCPGFYTFCIHIFDHIINNTVETLDMKKLFGQYRIDHELTASKSHYHQLNNLTCKLNECILEKISDLQPVKDAKDFLRREGNELIARIHDNMPPKLRRGAARNTSTLWVKKRINTEEKNLAEKITQHKMG